MLRNLLATMRPDQWTKNLVLFAGLLFAGGLGDAELMQLSLSGFLVFCLLSSASYILNDLADMQRDREHPEKRLRPLASGQLSVGLAAAAGLVMAAGALVWAYSIYPSFGHVAAAYLGMNVLYSLALRKMVILDVMSIAIGYPDPDFPANRLETEREPAENVTTWLGFE